MDHFPIFIAMKDRRVVLSGGGAAAIAKLRLLLKTTAQIHVYAPVADPIIQSWAQNNRLILTPRDLLASDCDGAALIYAANEDAALDAAVLEHAKDSGALVNVVDNLQDSQFITPAIVDRDPVTIAIGTEGAAPVLARAIKADLEAKLPTGLGELAQFGKNFRHIAERLPKGRARRDFWRAFYFDAGPKALAKGGKTIRQALQNLFLAHQNKEARETHVAFVGAGPGDPDLLTLKSRRLIDEADVVIHDNDVPLEILELARREALIFEVNSLTASAGDNATGLIASLAVDGAQIVRIAPGTAQNTAIQNERESCARLGIGHSLSAGIADTAPSPARTRLIRPYCPPKNLKSHFRITPQLSASPQSQEHV